LRVVPVLATEAIFAANRSNGRVALRVDINGGHTRRTRVEERGPLRVRFPTPESDACEALFVNTAGGIAGGDSLSMDLTVGAGAHLAAGTVAAEKIYRSTGSDAAISLNIAVEDAASLHWLPEETILFDKARLSRRIDINLAAGATLVFAEALIFGRTAMGETVSEGKAVDRWRLRRGGKLVFADTMRLTGPIAGKLARPAVNHGGAAVATVIIAPGDQSLVDRVRTAAAPFAGVAGISAWNGIAVARFSAGDGTSLRHDLRQLLTALDIRPPRLWLQ
jgi:urease accessory protein